MAEKRPRETKKHPGHRRGEDRNFYRCPLKGICVQRRCCKRPCHVFIMFRTVHPFLRTNMPRAHPVKGRAASSSPSLGELHASSIIRQYGKLPSSPRSSISSIGIFAGLFSRVGYPVPASSYACHAFTPQGITSHAFRSVHDSFEKVMDIT